MRKADSMVPGRPAVRRAPGSARRLPRTHEIVPFPACIEGRPCRAAPRTACPAAPTWAPRRSGTFRSGCGGRSPGTARATCGAARAPARPSAARARAARRQVQGRRATGTGALSYEWAPRTAGVQASHLCPFWTKPSTVPQRPRACPAACHAHPALCHVCRRCALP